MDKIKAVLTATDGKDINLGIGFKIDETETKADFLKLAETAILSMAEELETKKAFN